MVTVGQQQTPQIDYREPQPGTVYTSKLDYDITLPDYVADTLVKNFLRRVEELGDKTAMRKKRYGLWLEHSWNDVYEHVTNFFHGLISLGLQKGETVAFIGENDPEVYWTQIAAHSAGAMTCGVFSDALPDPDILYVVEKTGATFIVAHDQEQVDKALAVKDQITPQVRRVIYWEPKGMRRYDDPWLSDFKEIENIGARHKQENPDLFAQSVAQTSADDTIILSMTSGTTNLPKFAMITNTHLITGNATSYRYMPVNSDDNWLSFSAMAWLVEQAWGFAPHLMHGMQVNFPEGPETVQTDMREIAPVGLLFPSRAWENMASMVRFRINDSTWINRKLYDIFMPVASRVIDYEDSEEPIPAWLKFMNWLGEVGVFQPLRDRLGLTRARNVLTSGALLSPDVIRFFRAIGVELRQLYGATETYGTLQIPGEHRLDTVGILLPGIEIKITDDQEILLRTEARFAGYFGDPDKTGEAIDKEGWYYTSDAGYMREDGHLVYLDRLKDLIELANGHKFSPQFIEGRLKFSPYIQDILTIGSEDTDYVTAIVIIDFENVSRWAEKRGISFTTLVDLSQKPETYALIREEIQEVNESLPEASRLRKFVILHKEFDADEGELTRTRKLKRRTLYQKYSEILDALYGKAENVSVRAEVRYRDGRQGVVETQLSIADVSE